MKRTGIIYKYTSPTGISYIGQTLNEANRKLQHKREANKGNDFPFYKAIRQFGFESFTYEVLFKFTGTEKEVKKVLNMQEKFYIQYYNSYKNGYNCTRGGKVIPRRYGITNSTT